MPGQVKGHDNGEMWSPELTEDEYERSVESLRGAGLVEVTYYPLSCGDDDADIEERDCGVWHQPTMGVGLLAEDGTQYSAVWGHSFDHYGLEVFRGPMSDHLNMIGQPGGTPAVVVTPTTLVGQGSSGFRWWVPTSTGPRATTESDCRLPSSCVHLLPRRGLSRVVRRSGRQMGVSGSAPMT
ncbi:hypothetical protein [Streptomyces sp. NPDC059215]|uniref:hypothetical protein n=1 Tax=Streptomyces sp. NPDC059215 TaxID=3346772 RepID=UPI003676C78A